MRMPVVAVAAALGLTGDSARWVLCGLAGGLALSAIVSRRMSAPIHGLGHRAILDGLWKDPSHHGSTALSS